MELLRRRKPTAQFWSVVFSNQLADRGLQRIGVPVSPASLLGNRHDGMSRCAPQFLRTMHGIPGAKLAIRTVEKFPRRLRILLDLHFYLSAYDRSLEQFESPENPDHQELRQSIHAIWYTIKRNILSLFKGMLSRK